MRPLNAKLRHRGENHGPIIVARCALWRRVALPITRIIERDGPPVGLEVIELGPPNGFVGADTMEEHDRRRIANARILIADRNAGRGHHPGHWLILAAEGAAR